jgi:hypothetical protein
MIVQVPSPVVETIVPTIVQSPLADKLTGRPDDAVAFTANAGSRIVLSAMG